MTVGNVSKPGVWEWEEDRGTDAVGVGGDEADADVVATGVDVDVVNVVTGVDVCNGADGCDEVVKDGNGGVCALVLTLTVWDDNWASIVQNSSLSVPLSS